MNARGYMTVQLWHKNKRKCKEVHRLLALHFLVKTGDVVDHIDGNPMNNNISNLRWCSRSQNSMNSKSRKGSSKYKGVYFSKSNKGWCACIKPKGHTTIHLGTFKSEEGASLAYNKKAKELFGNFAFLN